MLTKNQRAEVLIESCTPEGYGVCRLEGRAVFVSSALEGERWEILILRKARRSAVNQTVRISAAAAACVTCAMRKNCA